MRSAYLLQFDADLYISTRLDGTYIEPKYPKYEEYRIGVSENVAILTSVSVATDVDKKYMLSRVEQLLKALQPTDEHTGKVISRMDEHSTNASPSIRSHRGKLICCKFEQPKNALAPMYEHLGKLACDILQLRKAPKLIYSHTGKLI